MKNKTIKQKNQKIMALFFGLTLLLMGVANIAFAQDINLTWDTNQESDVAFYNVYFKDMETLETWQEPGPAHDPAANTVSHQVLGLDPTRQYCFRVTAMNDSNIESPTSQKVCTTISPDGIPGDIPESTLVTFPNGAETLDAGAVQTLTWAASPKAASYTLRYSVDLGATWETIAKVSNVNSYAWKVPNVNSKTALFKVKAKDASGASIGSDKSDSVFTIKRVRVTSPNGAESIKTGTVEHLAWAASPKAVSYKLLYSTNGGATWEVIAKVSDTNVYKWQVPDVSSNMALFRVIAKNAKGKRIGSDKSDAAFTIVRPVI